MQRALSRGGRPKYLRKKWGRYNGVEHLGLAKLELVQEKQSIKTIFADYDGYFNFGEVKAGKYTCKVYYVGSVTRQTTDLVISARFLA